MIDWAEPLTEPFSLALEIAPLAVLGATYSRRARTLAGRGRPVPRARQLSFATGLLLMLVAVASPLAHVAEELFTVHMLQHILLGDLAALAIALGLTGPVLAPLLRKRPVARLRVLTHPLVAFPLWLLDLYIWHLAALYQATLESAIVHASMHILLLGLGLTMWMPLVGPLPVPRWFSDWARLGYLVAVRMAGALLANVFIWADIVFYPAYADGQRAWGIDPLADQATAGAILMTEGSVLTLGLLLWLFLRAAQRDEARQELLDFAAEQGVALDEARAARAAGAGRTDALRERLRRRSGANDPDGD